MNLKEENEILREKLAHAQSWMQREVVANPRAENSLDIAIRQKVRHFF